MDGQRAKISIHLDLCVLIYQNDLIDSERLPDTELVDKHKQVFAIALMSRRVKLLFNQQVSRRFFNTHHRKWLSLIIESPSFHLS